MSRLTLIDSADTATHLPSFTAPAYLVTRSYSGIILDSFSIKHLNQFTYLPETWAPGLFEQALAINVAVFLASSTQAWVFLLFSTLERSIRKKSILQSEVPAHDDANKSMSISAKALLYMMHKVYIIDLVHHVFCRERKSASFSMPLPCPHHKPSEKKTHVTGFDVTVP